MAKDPEKAVRAGVLLSKRCGLGFMRCGGLERKVSSCVNYK